MEVVIKNQDQLFNSMKNFKYNKIIKRTNGTLSVIQEHCP